MPVLQFKGKTAVENYHHTVPHHRLEFDAKLSLLGKGEKPSLDGNLIIEGDNLLALKALLPTHAGKVKCVYIDPPYNTGDEGWVYNDNLTQPQFKEWIGRTVGKEGEDACRHDKWCCMMYPRLTLLRELLRDDGVILVSIDENEVTHLRPILDELFGNENFLEQVVWEKSYGGGAKSKHFVRLHEYVLCYAKNKASIGRLSLPPDPSAKKYYKYEDSKVNQRGKYRLQPLWTNSMDERKNLRYPIERNGEEIWPEKQWQWSEDRVKEALDNDEIVFVDSESGVSAYYKQYERDEDGVERGSKPFSVIEGTFTQQGTNELNAVFDGKPNFKFPKPSALIRHLAQIFTSGSDIILDSFAGSGTTGHAILSLNGDDHGDRRFVLVQMPYDNKEYESENLNICQRVTVERVRRVAQGYSYSKKSRSGKNQKESVEGLGGTFTYARLGPPLFGEYKDFGDELPAYEDIAKYIFYTETSREFPGTTKKQNPAWDKKTGRIGEHAGRSYYLLYEPNEREDRGLDRKFLKEIAVSDPNRELIVYCERLAVHQDELRKFEREQKKKIRHMLVPFNLK